MGDANNLLDEMARLCTIGEEVTQNENGQIEPANLPEYSEALHHRIVSYFNAAEDYKKTIDPKIKKTQEKLPIFKRKEDLIQALQDNQVLIVIGETGSGKTTQLPQYLKEIGLAVKGRIGCTQLRRMAAKAVAKRVAREQGCKLGEEVGYTIRFEDCTSPKTQIQYMTDGILLRECTYDRTLTSYSAIILDESHERTVDTDILLGVLRWIINQRNDLKLIISSATLDAKKFSSYFLNAEIFNISGRMFPVEEIYVSSYSQIGPQDYVTQAYHNVIRINEKENDGDIMIFMSGENDIEELHEFLDSYRNSLYPTLLILPCYSALPWDDQAKIFEQTPPGMRKVVIATNIAETSLTVDNIRYVIDSGYVKQKVYDHRRDIEVLRKIRVSQAQAIQRAGRAGRVAEGKCYRLYSKQDFDSFVSGPEPEIKRSSLTSAILILKKMGFKDLSQFHFIDEPPSERVDEAVSELKFFSAIDESGEITEIGKKMASFPLEPTLAKMLITSEKMNCADEMLTIVALLSVANIYIRPKKKQKKADEMKATFFTTDGDLLTMFNVYKKWLMHDKSSDWCRENFIHNRMLHEACKIREQLYDLMISRDMSVKSAGPNTMVILKSICSGFIQNVAQRTGQRYSYITLAPNPELVFIHPGSALFRSTPTWVVYQKVIQTKKPYLRGVTPITPEWLKEFTPVYSKSMYRF